MVRGVAAAGRVPGRHQLDAGDYRLVLAPARCGSVARFDWRGEPLFRPTCGPSILDTACFPLAPFSNRIAQGAFRFGGTDVRLAPNFPGGGQPHPLHGLGWLAAWEVAEHSARWVVLRHVYTAAEWPWDYLAEQRFELTSFGLLHSLSVTNRSTGPMPAGLGFHPYFPRMPQTRYRGLRCGEWQTVPDGLPQMLDERAEAIDWWQGQPADTRAVDTVYTRREGPLELMWPERDITLTLAPSDNLGFTVVYTPVGADFLCVEPVSHATDAINRNGMQALAPNETLLAYVAYHADSLGGR
jgi:aldose 1-epimerase